MAEQPPSPLARAKERLAQRPQPATGQQDAEGRVPAGQRLSKGFPVLDLGIKPRFDPATWLLHVHGLVPQELRLSYDEVRALPATSLTADFHCVTRWSKLDVGWKGVLFSDLLQLASPDDRWRFLIQEAGDGYTTDVPRADLERPSVLLAYELDGQPLPGDHGSPLRMIVPHLYGWKGAKFLSGLRFVEHDEPGYWEVRGYHRRGDAALQERFG